MKKRRTLLAVGILAFVVVGVGIFFFTQPGPKPLPTNPEPTDFGVLVAEIEPAHGSIVQGNEVWVRWRAAPEAKGKVHWRLQGEEAFQPVDANLGDFMMARLRGLRAGQCYEFKVEENRDNQRLQSGIQTFVAKDGLVFEPTAEQTIQRDYDQTVMLTLRNNSDQKVVVAAKAWQQFADLPTDIVGPGSVDEPVEVPPGGKLELRLAVTAPDAMREVYEIPVEASGAFTTVKVRVAKPALKLTLRVVGEDLQTLAKTVEIQNDGDTLADLAVAVVAPHDRETRLNPGTNHAYLGRGKTLQFVATPVLYLEFTQLKIEVECRAAGQSTRFPLAFTAPEGKRLIGIRSGSTQSTGNNDWYCTNKPTGCSEAPGANANGGAPNSGSGADGKAFRPSSTLLAQRLGADRDKVDIREPLRMLAAEPAMTPKQCEDERGSLVLKFNRVKGQLAEAKSKLQTAQNAGNPQDIAKWGSIIADLETLLTCLRQEWDVLKRRCGVKGGPLDDAKEPDNPADYPPYQGPCRNDEHCKKNCYDKAVELEGKIRIAVGQNLRKPSDPIPIGKLKEYETEWNALKKKCLEECKTTLPEFAKLKDDITKALKAESGASLPRPPRPIGLVQGPVTPIETVLSLQPWLVMLHGAEAETAPDQPVGPMLRPGLLHALEHRAGFSRHHRGPLAGALEGDEHLADSSGAAVGWHTGERVGFAWHDHYQIVFAAFDPRGEVQQPPDVIGTGRWPRLTMHGQRTAVAWKLGDGFFVRVHDGKQWGSELALRDTEVCLAFAIDGTLFAAAKSGLWKLNEDRFQRVRETPYFQPALVLDSKGQPHVASCKDGKVVVDDKAVDDGERPTLTMTADGTVHLAYLAKGGVVVRSRQGDKWNDAETLAIKEPAWPALAQGDGSVRLTYLGAAERGPAALWLVRLPDKEPILVPSLEGNVTDVSLLLHFGLRDGRWKYRRHDVLITVNDVWIQLFRDAIPEGRFLFPLDPHKVFTSPGRPATNRVALHTWHMNGGHYVVLSEYQFLTRTAWSEWYSFAANAADARKAAEAPGVNHDKPDLAVLANSLNLPTDPPKDGHTELTVTVANLGEGPSAQTPLVMKYQDKVLAGVAVPPLKPGQQETVTMMLEGKVPLTTLKLEPAQPDFDTKNDTLTLRLWSDKDPELSAQPSGSAIQIVTDDRNLMGYRNQVGKTLSFVVTGRAEGPVWGTGVYTDDSSLGKSAVHAGILRVGERKRVRVQILPGRSSYRASTRHGIESSSWGSWEGSFRFLGGDAPEDIDLRTWTQQGPKANGQWELGKDGLSVIQKNNGNPTFFVSPDEFLNTTLKGKLKVEITGDDDFIGFVFGYRSPVAVKGDKDSQYDFLVFEWKQEDQENTKEGFGLVRVKGEFSRAGEGFWDRKESEKFKVLATRFGQGLGWKDNHEHEFELRYEARRIVIKVDGQPVFDVTAKEGEPDFQAGRFGFYNYSQAEVRYSGFTAQVGGPPIP